MKKLLPLAFGAVVITVPALGKSPQLVLGGSVGINSMKGKIDSTVTNSNPDQLFTNVPAVGKNKKRKNVFQAEFLVGGRFFPHERFFLGPEMAMAILNQLHTFTVVYQPGQADYRVTNRMRRNCAFKPGLALGTSMGRIVLGVKVGAVISRFGLKLHQYSGNDNQFYRTRKTRAGLAIALFGEYAISNTVSATLAAEVERIKIKHTFPSIDAEVAERGNVISQRIKYRTRGANVKVGVVYKVGSAAPKA